MNTGPSGMECKKKSQYLRHCGVVHEKGSGHLIWLVSITRYGAASSLWFIATDGNDQ